MASATYGDSGARAPTTSIYTYHIDSRNREVPLTASPSTYTVKLGAEVQRVKTLQVGDAQLPTDARSVIDSARRHLQVSEPLKLDDPTTLSLTETTRTYSLADGSLLSTTVHAAVTVDFPATLNAVASAAGSTLTLSNPHHMDTVIAYWPTSSLLVGTRAVNYDVALDAVTVASYPSATQLTLDGAFVADVLTHTVGPLAALSDVVVGASDNATLYVTPLTIPEWVDVLARVLEDLTASGTLTQPYSLRLNTQTGLVELECKGGDRVSRAQRVETSVQFTVVAGDALWRLGFPAGTWSLPTYRNLRLDAGTGRRQDGTPFVMAVVPRDVRTIQLRRGKYAAIGDLTDELTRATNTLYLPTTLSTGARTLAFTDIAGVARSVVIPGGRYTPTQLAVFLESSMNAAPTIGGAFSVTANAEASGAGGFTIADTLERPFALEFSDVGPATVLGYEPLRLAGAATYTSTREAFCGASSATDVDMGRTITWSASTSTGALRAVAGRPIPSADANVGAGLGTNGFTVAFTQLGTGVGGTPVAMHLALNDLVRLSDGTQSVLALVRAAPTGEVGVSPINTAGISFGAVLLGVGNDLDTTVAALLATPVGRPVFVLHMAPLPSAVQATPQDLSGITVQNATLASPERSQGMGVSFGPLAEQLGLTPTTLSADDGGVILASGVYSLDPPPYLLLAILSPSFLSERAVFRPTGTDDTRPVIAKFIVSNGYARITEESTHVTLTSPINLSTVRLEWLNPDGTLVDWNGANHSFSLLMRTFEGHVGGGAVH